jgi:hypothetical protein
LQLDLNNDKIPITLGKKPLKGRGNMDYLYRILVSIMLLMAAAGLASGCTINAGDDDDDTTSIDDDDDDDNNDDYVTGECEEQDEEEACDDLDNCTWLDVTLLPGKLYPAATSGPEEWDIVCIDDAHPCFDLCDTIMECMEEDPLRCYLDCSETEDQDSLDFDDVSGCIDEAADCDAILACLPEDE